MTHPQCPSRITVAYRHTDIARAITVDERTLLLADPFYVFREEASPLCNCYFLIREPKFYQRTTEEVRHCAEGNTRDKVAKVINMQNVGQNVCALSSR